MPIAKEFTVQTEDRPGLLGKVCRALANRRVNIIAVQASAMDDQGVIRIVVDTPVAAKVVLEAERLPYTEADVVLTKLPHHPGELGRAASRLGDANINIHHAYIGVDPQTNEPFLVLGVGIVEVGRAVAVLERRQGAAAAAVGAGQRHIPRHSEGEEMGAQQATDAEPEPYLPGQTESEQREWRRARERGPKTERGN
jgi:hypothetical protein